MLSISHCIKGIKVNAVQKIKKNIIMEGFGFIRYFKNMLLVKKKLDLQM